MKIKSECYSIKCDCCGETFETGAGYACYVDDPDGFLIWSDACASGWQAVGDKHFCDNCWNRDDDDNIITKDGRKFTENGEEIKEE